ncbi:2-phosphosulfolactate phosphatase [Heyndrickxia acidicola]|uniref:Probable 2-phosphosulfolactate phosphatase n=1 Tax=Heyndrickxia acidicola TaxID=209389 RepID=A0ABU6MHA1_9BACI|nr:2-phosphosulfolactate phosphatase [Heyndrickxia acidicola]MED1204056.1 2-phosphosulfolactate phosphatase [Heyndrickxia acidicola]
MPKLHVILKKEEIDKEKIAGKVAVVLDVLLATSTITAALYYGAKEVIPALNEQEARDYARRLEEETYCLVGEFNGKTIEGFMDPNPGALKDKVSGKTVILSTTNGTVAINKSRNAKQLYAASILNGKAVADRILFSHHETVIIICSGSSDQLSLEDFYGAGYLLDCLLREEDRDWELTDASKAALYFYKSQEDQSYEILKASRVGKMLTELGFEEELKFTASQNRIPIIPVVKGSSIRVEEYFFHKE